MSQQALNYGTAPSDGEGANLFTLFGNSQSNFTELYDGLGGRVLKSGVAVQLQGSTTTNETALATIILPPIGANGLVLFSTAWSMTSSGNTKEARARLGGTGLSGTSIALLSATTITSAEMNSRLRTLNSTSSQLTISNYPRGTDMLITQNIASASTIDLSVAQNLTFSGKCANSADTMNLLGYVVQIIK